MVIDVPRERIKLYWVHKSQKFTQSERTYLIRGAGRSGGKTGCALEENGGGRAGGGLRVVHDTIEDHPAKV